MYKILLVDDEILIRERVAKRIKWKALGYELVATCENGQEAIHVLETEQIDVVLTDICMPYIDGLQLSEYIYENKPSIKIIILSGYAEFEFAKQAMKYHVSSYLLKPITSEELSQVLVELRNTLDEEKQNHQMYNVPQDAYSLFRIQNLYHILEGEISTERIREILKAYQPKFYREHGRYSTALLCPEKPLARAQLEQVEQTLNSFSDQMIAVSNVDNSIVMLVRAENNQDIRCFLQEVGIFIRSYIYEHFRISAAILCGMDVPDCSCLFQSYEQTRKLKEFIYLEKENGLYFWDDYNKASRKINLIAFENAYEKEILIAVQSNLHDEINAILTSIIEEARENWYRKPRVISTCQSVLISLVNNFQRMGIEDFTIFERAQQVLEGLYQCELITHMTVLVKEFLVYAANVRNENRESYGERQAVLSLEYIEQNFSDCDFSVANMCEKLAISVSYFSAAFKDYTGKTFIEVLTDRRMQEAKTLLLNSNLKTYEIAERCGYRDSGYFSTLFKKYFHMTPKEYIKTNRK